MRKSASLAARPFFALLLALALPGPGSALDRYEIQVYQADVNKAGHLGLELHTNYTAQGNAGPSYPGEVPPQGAARFTLEPSYGLTDWLELGAYVQLLAAPSGTRYAGSKVRAKMVLPRLLGDDLFLGLNVELARVPTAIEEEGWSAELRPFLGYEGRYLLVALNPILGFALAGKDVLRPRFEPALKVSVNSQLGFALGAEYYAELGFLDAPSPLREEAHYLFGVLDLVPAGEGAELAWELNLGVGGGLTPGTDQKLILKAILGHSF